jgi:hypothetical protein
VCNTAYCSKHTNKYTPATAERSALKMTSSKYTKAISSTRSTCQVIYPSVHL